MKIRTINSVKGSDGKWVPPGSVREYPDDEAKDLIVKGAAEALEDQEEELTNDEYVELADDLERIDGVNAALAGRLVDAGFSTIKFVADADPEELVRIKGIGKRSVEAIQESAEELAEADEDEE